MIVFAVVVRASVLVVMVGAVDCVVEVDGMEVAIRENRYCIN